MESVKKSYYTVLYTFGQYQVRLIRPDSEYQVYNTNTEVVEHRTTKLYEAAQMAQIFDNLLKEIDKPTSWAQKIEDLSCINYEDVVKN